MITIKNLDPITEAPETFGYISLGTLCINRDAEHLIDMLRPGIYKGECDSSGKTFDLYLFKIGATGSYAVLGDLTCVPGNTLVDNQELLETLKNELEVRTSYLNNNYLKATLDPSQDIYSSPSIIKAPYLPLTSCPTTGVASGVYAQGTTTISDPTKNFTFKVDYANRP